MTADRDRASLARDSRGALMVMALFMAVVAAGALYYLWGLGDAMLMRQMMQDAADATAFSTAIIHARGMNLLALFNMIMASILAALILLKLVAAAASIAAGIAAGLWFVPGAVGAAAALFSASTALHSAAIKAERVPVPKLLQAVDTLSSGVRRIVPYVAEAHAVGYAAKHYAPPAEFGVAFPLHSSLPAVDGTFDRLCAKAGEYTADLIAWPIKKILHFDFLAKLVKKVIEGLVSKFSAYFCGKGTPPTVEVTRSLSLPMLAHPDQRACVEDRKAEACERYGTYHEQVTKAFDLERGSCSHPDARIERACEQLLASARTSCDPKEGAKGLEKWLWREVELERVYRLEPETKRVILESEEEVPGTARKLVYGDSSASSSPSKPCLELALVPPWSPWNRDPTQPVCEWQPNEPSVFELERDPDQRVTRRLRVVSDVVSCVQEKKEERTLESSQASEALKKAKPEEICNCAELGEEIFQIRAFVKSDPDPFLQRGRDRVGVAGVLSAEAPSESRLANLLDAFGDGSFAQAEFYVEGEHAGTRAEWMWHLHWKARLRRTTFVQDTGWTCEKRRNDCPRPMLTFEKVCRGGACKQLRRRIEGILLH